MLKVSKILPMVASYHKIYSENFREVSNQQEKSSSYNPRPGLIDSLYQTDSQEPALGQSVLIEPPMRQRTRVGQNFDD